MPNLNDVVSGVYARIGSNNIVDFTYSEITNLADDARLNLEGAINTSIGSTSIGSIYLPAITDLTAANVMARMLSINIDTDVSVGNIRLQYSSDLQAHSRLMDFYLMKAERSINNTFGGRIAHTYTIKTP